MLDPKGFGWVGGFAEDLPKLANFYETTLGLKVIEHSDRCYLFDAGAGALFELSGRGHAAATRKTPREQSMIIGFVVERLEPVVAALAERGLHSDSPIDSYLGTRWIHYTDPEGNRFELKDLYGESANRVT